MFSPSFAVRPAGIPGGAGRQGPGGGNTGAGVPQPVPVVAADTSLLVRGGRTGRGLARLRLLETYSRALLEAAERVSQSPALTGFFAPQPLDLEPTLPPGRCLTRPQLPARGTWRLGERVRGGGRPLSGPTDGLRLGGLRRRDFSPAPAALPSLVILPAPEEPPTRPPDSLAIRSLEAQSLRCLQPFSTQDTRGQPFQAQAQEALDVLLRHPSGGAHRTVRPRPSAPSGLGGLNLPPTSCPQAGGWWQTKTSRQHGFLLPTWRKQPRARSDRPSGGMVRECPPPHPKSATTSGQPGKAGP